MQSAVLKRSIVVDGHKTRVSLEDAFWEGLKEIGLERRISLSQLVAAIDGQRQHGNLSSAVRARLLSRPAFGSERGAQQDARDNGPCDACLFLITRTILKCLGMAGISAFGDLPRRRRCRETYCVAGHVGLELRNPCASHVFEIS